jgi:deazaflavin-dependent oxidoreductase (nitroreductase family)
MGNTNSEAWVKPAFVDVHLALYAKDPDKAHYQDLRAMGIEKPVATLLLTTTGWKSGQKRTTPLNYEKVDGNYIVVASKGGYTDDPLWYKNLVANPEADVQAGRDKCHARMRVAKGAERARLWDIMAKVYPPYLEYATAAPHREIPVVVLEPVG